MNRWKRFALAATCCALFAACSTSDPATVATSAGIATCRDACDEAFNKCEQRCDPDDNICPEACVDAISSCKKHCG